MIDYKTEPRTTTAERIRNGQEDTQLAFYAALMSDVMRGYLAARVDLIQPSHTSSELLASAPQIHAHAPGLGDLLWRTDLIKFANNTVDPGEADRLGAAARGIVRAVEIRLREQEGAAEAKAA